MHNYTDEELINLVLADASPTSTEPAHLLANLFEKYLELPTYEEGYEEGYRVARQELTTRLLNFIDSI